MRESAARDRVLEGPFLKHISVIFIPTSNIRTCPPDRSMWSIQASGGGINCHTAEKMLNKPKHEQRAQPVTEFKLETKLGHISPTIALVFNA